MSLVNILKKINCAQGSTLRCAHMPGSGRFCPRAHKIVWSCAWLGKWFFFGQAHTYFSSSIYITFYRACSYIGWVHEYFCMAIKFLEARAQWACKLNTIKWRYNAVQFITILHTALRRQQQNVNQTSDSQQTPHTSPSRASNGVSIMWILKKIDRVIMAQHCT